MVFCSNCGKELTENARFCDACGAYVQEGSDNRAQTAFVPPAAGPVVPPQQSMPRPGSMPPPAGTPYGSAPNNGPYQGYGHYQGPPQPQAQQRNDDPGSWVLLSCLLAIFVSFLVGLILWAVWKDDYPNKAEAVKRGTIRGVIINLVFVAVYIFLVIGLVSCGAYGML